MALKGLTRCKTNAYVVFRGSDPVASADPLFYSRSTPWRTSHSSVKHGARRCSDARGAGTSLSVAVPNAPLSVKVALHLAFIVAPSAVPTAFCANPA